MSICKKLNGFTLIELMIAVAIVAILATIAYPSYLDHVRKTRRAEAKSIILDIQLKEEKWRANNTSYGNLASVGGLVSNQYYNFNVDNIGNNTYRVTATAKGDQTNDKQSGTVCTPLTIDQSGTKNPAICWQ